MTLSPPMFAAEIDGETLYTGDSVEDAIDNAIMAYREHCDCEGLDYLDDASEWAVNVYTGAVFCEEHDDCEDDDCDHDVHMDGFQPFRGYERRERRMVYIAAGGETWSFVGEPRWVEIAPGVELDLNPAASPGLLGPDPVLP